MRIDHPIESGSVMTGTAGTASEALGPELRRFLSGKVCVLGVGNRYRRDDGAGSLIAERLAGRTEALCVDAGAVPENYLEKVARSKPDTILIVDAADFGCAPGRVCILDPQSVDSAALSTHALSLRMTADFLQARTSARLALLAIQPADVRSGTEISEEVSRAVERLQETLSEILQMHITQQHPRSGTGAEP